MRGIKLLIALLFFLPSTLNAFCYEEAGNAYSINPLLLESIAGVESGFNPGAVNRNTDGSIDMGLMQINSSWIPSLGLDPGRLFSDPCYNVTAGARILKGCIDKYGYTWEAVGCYNALNRQKRVGYSWKVFNTLKAESRRQSITQGTEGNKSFNTRNSSLSFTIKDGASIE